MKFVIIAIMLLGVAAQAETYTIDKDHSNVSFTIRHLVSKVTGNFDDFSGTINFDDKSPTKGGADVDIKTASIDTRVDKRNEHLKSPDFFDVAKYPDMTFKTTKVTGSAKKLKVTGDLTLHGVTKPVTLDAEFGGTTKDPWGNTRVGFSGKTKINRKDFGLTWNKAIETGGLMVGDDVDITLDIEAIKKAPDKAADKPADKAPAAQ